ncbi:MAG: [acyl-carrier-protein] S-malonyltransferase [Legionella sp.]|nr:MAG: [acyl-carrier-protein] S-malonyltransferase [Legionella sp.]
MTQKAIVFPGQGSQYVGMLADLATVYPDIKHSFAEVSDHVHYDVWDMIQQGPEEKLNQTEHTQVAMLTANVALFKAFQVLDSQLPEKMAGHSLGEYAALVCADAISLVDAAKLVQIRGRLMQETIPLGMGAMAAIVGLSDEQVRAICLDSTTEQEQVSPANYNAIGQVVIAGHHAAVLKAIALAEAQDARIAKLIPVSVPCHCALLQPAAVKFAQALADVRFSVPKYTVISNVDLSIYQSVEQIRTLLQQQLYSPVRWVETIQMMQENGIETIVECGPGKVLGGLIKRIDKSLQVVSAYETLLQHVKQG